VEARCGPSSPIDDARNRPDGYVHRANYDGVTRHDAAYDAAAAHVRLAHDDVATYVRLAHDVVANDAVTHDAIAHDAIAAAYVLVAANYDAIAAAYVLVAADYVWAAADAASAATDDAVASSESSAIAAVLPLDGLPSQLPRAPISALPLKIRLKACQPAQRALLKSQLRQKLLRRLQPYGLTICKKGVYFCDLDFVYKNSS